MLKVIIADDEERVCRLVQVLADWEALGMEVAGTASNGLEALELVKKIRPDILITDIRMPGCYGLELIQHAKEELPQLEIVIISGYAHFEYAQSAIKHGVGDYLLKPIQKQELMATLKKPQLLLLDEHTAALDPKTAAKVLSATEQIVRRDNLTTLMITHNMRDAIAHGNRLVMLYDGRVVVDVRGEEKRRLTVEDLLEKFNQASGSSEADDKLLLS